MSPGQIGHITGQMGRVPGTDGTHTRGCPAKILHVHWFFSFPSLAPSLNPNEPAALKTTTVVTGEHWTGSLGKRKHTPPCSLQCRTVLCRKKWGPQRKDFGGGYGFPGFYRVSVSTTGLESFSWRPEKFSKRFSFGGGCVRFFLLWVTKQEHRPNRGENCPKNVRKLCFQFLRTIFGHFLDFSTFFGHFVYIPLFWAVQRFARYNTTG